MSDARTRLHEAIEGERADWHTVEVRPDDLRALLDEPDALDGARLEYNACKEVRRLLGYLWMATGRSIDDPVNSLFDDDDPIRADIARLAIFPDGAER